MAAIPPPRWLCCALLAACGPVPAGSALEADPPSIDLRLATAAGAGAVVTVQVANTGVVDATVRAVAVDPPSPRLAVVASLPWTLHPGGSLPIEVWVTDLADLPADRSTLDAVLRIAGDRGLDVPIAFGVPLPCDADGDGYATLACSGDDCDDDDAGTHPGAVERCGGADEDCDGAVDEPGAEGEITWYVDADGDGFGTVEGGATCTPPPGGAPTDGDCDDGRATANPGAPETCGGKDDDCDGVVDEPGALGEIAWYADTDGDRFGGPERVVACDPPRGFVLGTGDCDDTREDVHPYAQEACDGADGDCDGTPDSPTPIGGRPWFADVDRDGYGGTLFAVSCAAPDGAFPDASDCDDHRPTAHPGAPETCGGKDDDCDGLVDEPGAEGECVYYRDVDGDGQGGPLTTLACSPPPGFVVGGPIDCDDTDPDVRKYGIEVCNGVDDDCDDRVDEPGAVGEQRWYVDDDGDGFGAGSSIFRCGAPGLVEDDSDCFDADPDVYPGHGCEAGCGFWAGDDDRCEDVPRPPAEPTGQICVLSTRSLFHAGSADVIEGTVIAAVDGPLPHHQRDLPYGDRCDDHVAYFADADGAQYELRATRLQANGAFPVGGSVRIGVLDGGIWILFDDVGLLAGHHEGTPRWCELPFADALTVEAVCSDPPPGGAWIVRVDGDVLVAPGSTRTIPYPSGDLAFTHADALSSGYPSGGLLRESFGFFRR